LLRHSIFLTLLINYFLYAFLSNAGDKNTRFSFFFCRIMKIYVKEIRNIMRLEKTINHQPCFSVVKTSSFYDQTCGLCHKILREFLRPNLRFVSFPCVPLSFPRKHALDLIGGGNPYSRFRVKHGMTTINFFSLSLLTLTLILKSCNAYNKIIL